MTKIIPLSPDVILNAMKLKKYRVFEGELNLNIIGVRSSDHRANTFNDVLCLLYQQKGKWQLKQYKATTDAGLYFRKQPCNVDGTAVLLPMQHKSCWRLGYHRGQYAALVQRGPMTVLRDNDKDSVIDTSIHHAQLQTGYFGINCHRASAQHESTKVDKWSAGCQVFANPKDFDEFMTLCRDSAKTYGPNFSYTLFEQADFQIEAAA
ncbi:hypothetical protein [Shewanella surugensis]|uniref:Uncharacterized protein n=1 Tax=Shewanella surugensis TaxID=212020 RepID=A0ABT0L6J3_9GAMM|nr:hypothetical protein [Shewanella surugensis]MCL1123303.1 hypothetical protein [Shewanella surugensis]